VRYLTLDEVVLLHHVIVERTSGSEGIRDRGLLESALAQPKMTFDRQALYPTIADKAAALGFSIVQNHPFVDGNKRTGHAVMELFLVLNGYEIDEDIDNQERVILQVASGVLDRIAFTEWVRSVISAR
jgi:death-on-curing protein